jgi:hypothetical protein
MYALLVPSSIFTMIFYILHFHRLYSEQLDMGRTYRLHMQVLLSFLLQS